MSRLRALLLAFVVFVASSPALAREQISVFDVAIEVETDGDIVVAETIEVIAEGNQIRRGIFRDLPRYYEAQGDVLPYRYDVLSVQRDGRNEPYETSADGNAFRIRIGDPDVLIEHGAHAYQIRYRVKSQVRYFDGYDEIYWNTTGNYWAFPIVRARAVVLMPPGARVTGAAAYTGALGEAGADYAYTQEGDRHVFETTRPLDVGHGLTVALGIEKGLIDPPSAADQGWLWWRRNGALLILLASLGGLFWFLYRSFERVGRDPVKPPVFPRYEAPEGYSPAAVHHIYYRGLNGHRALIATLMNLAVKGRFSIDASDRKTTTLMRAPEPPASRDQMAEDLALEGGVFGGASFKSLGERYDSRFTAAYAQFKRALSRKYGDAYFRWNVAYTVVALALTVAAIWFAATQTLNWTGWHTAAVLALAALNGLFMYLMPSPTPKGQRIRTEIEGFRLYMETAEKLQLNAVEVGGQAPPPMTVERYEKFLPYAVALGVEKPWTRHFERLIPEEARAYRPAWASGGWDPSRSLAGVSSAIVSNMTSGVTSALPQSSSSSGSGGGGSSGGGGGGGGGGGW
jgi:uncharacterized membrane protein YgcG